MSTNQNRVYFYILYSIIASTLMYAIVKYLVRFNIYQIIFFRSLGSLIFTIPLIVIYKIDIFGNNKSILLLRSIIGVFSMTFFFLSLKHIDLGISVTIRFMSPIFAVFFALLFLNERTKNIQWIFITISFVGVILSPTSKLYEKWFKDLPKRKF
jgi:drug/metabolite transporter (DMT)-like permease